MADYATTKLSSRGFSQFADQFRREVTAAEYFACRFAS